MDLCIQGFYSICPIHESTPPPPPLPTGPQSMPRLFLIIMAEAHQVMSEIVNKEYKLTWSCQMRLMFISFFVNSERTVFLSVKCDLDPSLYYHLIYGKHDHYVTNESLGNGIIDVFVVQSFRIRNFFYFLYYWVCHFNE